MTFTDEQIAALLEALGLPADTDDPQLVVDTVADLAAQAAGINTEKPSTIAAAAKKAGLEVIDTATAEALRRDAAEAPQDRRGRRADQSRSRRRRRREQRQDHPGPPQALGVPHRGRSRHGRRARRRPERDRRTP